jgi:hypothetical protein
MSVRTRSPQSTDAASVLRGVMRLSVCHGASQTNVVGQTPTELRRALEDDASLVDTGMSRICISDCFERRASKRVLTTASTPYDDRHLLAR